ncbi:MAG: amidohydrolase family protein [Armatimonadota bacterium]|nr:amidohydrolase family protein [Armatimonadota bacterium]
MLIDFHVHLGNCFRNEYPRGRRSPTVHQLIDWMDRNGIDMAVLQPLESPEVTQGYYLSEQAVADRDTYPERLIAFCCFDPRMREVPALIDTFVQRYGILGFGEALNGLAFDDERNWPIYERCAEHGIPYLFDMGPTCCWDEVGLPRLESMLEQFPETQFVGHGPGFWTAISAHDPRQGYPEGRIQPGGAIDRLMEGHENLWLDLSAGSGYNAMTRDREFARGFIDRRWRKMLFATDYFIVDQEIPNIAWFRSLDISEEMREAIGSGNALRLLGLAQ